MADLVRETNRTLQNGGSPDEEDVSSGMLRNQGICAYSGGKAEEEDINDEKRTYESRC